MARKFDIWQFDDRCRIGKHWRGYSASRGRACKLNLLCSRSYPIRFPDFQVRLCLNENDYGQTGVFRSRGSTSPVDFKLIAPDGDQPYMRTYTLEIVAVDDDENPPTGSDGGNNGKPPFDEDDDNNGASRLPYQTLQFLAEMAPATTPTEVEMLTLRDRTMGI